MNFKLTYNGQASWNATDLAQGAGLLLPICGLTSLVRYSHAVVDLLGKAEVFGQLLNGVFQTLLYLLQAISHSPKDQTMVLHKCTAPPINAVYAVFKLHSNCQGSTYRSALEDRLCLAI